MSPAERPEAFCIECGRLHYADELADDICLDCVIRGTKRKLATVHHVLLELVARKDAPPRERRA